MAKNCIKALFEIKRRYVIHFWELFSPNGILPGAKLTLRPSLALSYIASVTAWHSSSGRQPNFAAGYLHATGRPSCSNCLVTTISET